jgi:hypothetical protein
MDSRICQTSAASPGLPTVTGFQREQDSRYDTRQCGLVSFLPLIQRRVFGRSVVMLSSV